MSQKKKSETKTKKKRKRKRKPQTRPKKKVHRRMLELTTTKDQVDMLLNMTVKEYKRKLAADKQWEGWIMEMFVQGIIEPGNEHLDEQDKQDSMTLYRSDGMVRVQIGRQRNRSFDDRAHQAKAYIQDFINEHEERTISGNEDVKVIINMLRNLFFSTRKQKGFKFTPELQDFMAMDSNDLHDERLKKAQKILKDAFKVEASAWYCRVEEYNEEEGGYVSITAE